MPSRVPVATPGAGPSPRLIPHCHPETSHRPAASTLQPVLLSHRLQSASHHQMPSRVPVATPGAGPSPRLVPHRHPRTSTRSAASVGEAVLWDHRLPSSTHYQTPCPFPVPNPGTAPSHIFTALCQGYGVTSDAGTDIRRGAILHRGVCYATTRSTLWDLP